MILIILPHMLMLLSGFPILHFDRKLNRRKIRQFSLAAQYLKIGNMPIMLYYPFQKGLIIHARNGNSYHGTKSVASSWSLYHKSEWNTCCGYLISVCQLSFGS